jgi:Zn-dependent protease with chaperone function
MALTSFKRYNFLGLARLEWWQVVAFNFSTPLVSLCFRIKDDDTPYLLASLTAFTVEAAGTVFVYIGLGLMIALVVNQYRQKDTGSSAAQPLPDSIRTKLRQILEELNQTRWGINLERLRYNPTDLLMGAHVRGAVRPSIVVSGGMLVGLLQKDRRAMAILNHEAAHIEHFDALLPGLIGIGFIQIFGIPVKFVIDQASVDFSNIAIATAIMLYQLVVVGGFVWLLSIKREFYADASAAQYIADHDAYQNILRNALGHERERWSFFHPSLQWRLKEAKSNYRILKYAILWRFYFVLATAMSLLGIWGASEPSATWHPVVFLAQLCSGAVILLSEIFRGRILKLPQQPTLWVRGPMLAKTGEPVLTKTGSA